VSGEEEDGDIDSGWDDGEEEAPVTRAVDSRRLLAEVKSRLREADTITPPSPPGPRADLLSELAVPQSEPPETRRADDDALRQMRARAAGSAIRLGGRKATPIVPAPEPPRAKRFGAQDMRPTPPAGIDPGKAEPTALKPPPGGAGRSLRLDAENSPRKVAAQQRRTTLVSHAVREPDSPKAVSQPPLEIHLDSLDLPAPEGSPPSEKKLGPNELSRRHEAVTRPPPAPPDDLDSLPVDEMLSTARGSNPPPVPAAPAPPPPRPVPKWARLSLAEDFQADSGPAIELNPAPRLVELPPEPPSEPPPDSTVEVQVGDADALSDAELRALEAEDDPELAAVQERFDRGDFFGAANRAEALLEQRPDFEAARRYLESAREALVQMYIGRLGSGTTVLRVAMRPDEIQGLSLDHRSGFLISLIDGVATLDEVLDMSGMPPLDALRLLYEMREQGVVVVDSMRL
jgi:hypothetical protein